jgi:hypothetical protein
VLTDRPAADPLSPTPLRQVGRRLLDRAKEVFDERERQRLTAQAFELAQLAEVAELAPRSVASIIAQEVFGEIRKIARSVIPLPKRRAEATTRINQFKADLAAARHLLGVPEKQKENLRRMLQRGATQHDLTGEENNIYAEALDLLMGHAANNQRKARRCGAESKRDNC